MALRNGNGTGAAIFGFAGPRLTGAERRFFADADPAGFILFGRNCDSPEQVRAVVDELKGAVGKDWLPILIDQEGGRVARLKPPHWRAHPAAAVFGKLHARDPSAARRAAWLTGRLLADELARLGITVDCVPVLDVPAPGGHDIIGDRAFSDTSDTVIELARALTDGLEAGGVQPVIKHIPGHGRATADSHRELPVVSASADSLRAVDFPPFAAFRAAPWGMTAHVVYTAFDGTVPATLSATLIETVIRGELGFDGVLMTDDLSMKALGGDFRDRAERAIAAGCDLILHCNGDMAEMERVAEGAGNLGEAATRRLKRAEQLRQPPGAFDPDTGAAERDRLLAPLAGV